MNRYSTLKRTPFKTKARPPRISAADLRSQAARGAFVRLDSDAALPKRARLVKEPTNVPGLYRIAGHLWPRDYVPEEPLRPYETCFREMCEIELHRCGWSFFHVTDSRLLKAGKPDLECYRERPMHLELKVRDEKGKANVMSPKQLAFASTLLRAGVEFHCVLWPDDWDEFLGFIA